MRVSVARNIKAHAAVESPEFDAKRARLPRGAHKFGWRTTIQERATIA